MATKQNFIVNSGLVATTTATIKSNINASSTSTGALVVSGGAAVGRDLRVGGTAYISGDLYVDGTQFIVNSVSINTADKILVLSTASGTAAQAADSGIQVGSENNPYITWHFDGVDSWVSNKGIKAQSPINSTGTNSGALQVTGGAGIGGDLWVGGTIHGIIQGLVSTASSIVVNNTAPNSYYYIALTESKDSTNSRIDADAGITYNTINQELAIPQTSATSLHVVNKTNIGGTLNITGDSGYITILSYNGVSFLSDGVTGFQGGETVVPLSSGLGLTADITYYVSAVLSPIRFILSTTPFGTGVGTGGVHTIIATTGKAPGLVVAATLTSVSTVTGAAVIAGGVGIGGSLNVGGHIIGGGVRTTSSASAPTNPAPTVGDIWYNTTNDAIYRFTDDGQGNLYWIDITGPVFQLPQ